MSKKQLSPKARSVLQAIVRGTTYEADIANLTGLTRRQVTHTLEREIYPHLEIDGPSGTRAPARAKMTQAVFAAARQGYFPPHSLGADLLSHGRIIDESQTPIARFGIEEDLSEQTY